VFLGLDDSVGSDAGASDKTPYGRGATVGDYTYGYPIGVDDEVTENENSNGSYHWRTKFLRWNGGSSTASFTKYTLAPEGGIAVASHLNRVFVLGGGHPAGWTGGQTNIDPVALYFTDEAGPTSDTEAMWKDNVTGLVNKIIIGERNDPGQGLASHGGNLIIFKRNSVWVLYGYGSANFQLKKITSSRGCVDQNSILQADNGVYFMSQQGFEFFDGTTLTNVSGNIKPTLVQQVQEVQDPAMSDDNFCTIETADAGDGYLIVALTQESVVSATLTSATTPAFWLFYTPTREWARFSFTAGQSPPYKFLNRGPRNRLGIIQHDDLFKECAAITQPERTRDLGGQFGIERGLVIPTSFVSRRLQLAAPTNKVQFHRVFPHYEWKRDNPADGETDAAAWRYVIEREDATDLFDQTVEKDDTTNLYGAQPVYDNHEEATLVRLTVTNGDTVANSSVLSEPEAIYGTVIEYQPTRQARNA
jgi:hypothetical protein